MAALGVYNIISKTSLNQWDNTHTHTCMHARTHTHINLEYGRYGKEKLMETTGIDVQKLEALSPTKNKTI